MRYNTVAVIASIGSAVCYIIWKRNQQPPVKVIIDPGVAYSENIKKRAEMPPPLLIKPQIPILEPPVELPPHEKIGFGYDTSRNTDEHDLSSYLDLPLDGTGQTYANKDKYVDLDETTLKSPFRVKYIKLTVLETRSKGSTVSIGDIAFLYKNRTIKDSKLRIWNPYSGEYSYYTSPWTNIENHVVVFCFSRLVEVDKYEIKTSNLDSKDDPMVWTIEGSQNGSFWIPLDSQNKYLPNARNQWTLFKMKIP